MKYYSALDFYIYVTEHIWLNGILYILFGFLFGLLGKKHFVKITSLFISLSAFCLLMTFSYWSDNGTFDTPRQIIITVLIDLPISGFIYLFSHTERICVSLLIITSGIFLMTFMIDLVYLDQWYTMFIIIVLLGYIYWEGTSINRLSVFIGSYLCMRGATYV
jgi:hypothetical protein